MSQYFRIGRFVAPHGLSGSLILKHSFGKATSLKGMEALFLEKGKENFFPYFIKSSTKRSDDEVLIELEGVHNREDALKFANKPVWVTEEDFRHFAKKTAAVSFLGYHIMDGKNDLGEVIEVMEQPQQVLCTIVYKGKEAMIPVHGENLEKLDKKNKVIHVSLPEGLLDIYL